MACARCGKKAGAPFNPAGAEGARPRPVLRQRPVRDPARAALTRRFRGQPPTTPPPADQPGSGG